MSNAAFQPFDHVTIVGVGLLGASLGLALKERGLARHVTGVGRRETSLRTAQDRGAVDDATLNLLEGAAHADLVVIATPAALVAETMDAMLPHLRPGAVVTDVASTKAAICAHADATWPAPRRFIGSHPMAGSEQFGPEHGRADLYEDSVCLVESADGLDPQAHARVTGLWGAVGARVVEVDSQEHDALLARTSHLPHIAASALALCAAQEGRDLKPFIGGGFRDTTRIAAGRAEIWRDICLTNRTAILGALADLEKALAGVRGALAAEDAAALEAFFERGRQARLNAVPE